MFSSQNEQDSRYYAMASLIPVLEPSDSAEAHRFAKEAYEISEQFDTPVMMRSTVRISHTKTPVEIGQRQEIPKKHYEKDPSKWVMMPAFAKPRRKVLVERIVSLRKWVETCPYNVVERASEQQAISSVRQGIICSGSVYQHVKEACPQVDVFKLGVTWPLPKNALQDFANSVDEVYVVEEASTYLSDAVKSCGIVLNDFKVPLPPDGELTPSAIRISFGLALPEHKDSERDIPNRPPALCPGCPHRIIFKELSRLRAIVTGDIGCYTLGALPPLSAMDTTLDMGASVSMAHGFELALEGDHRPVVAVIGDSTFAHSGLTSLMNTIYNKGAGTVCILDNRTTAMTGQQGNPFNGVTLQNRPSRELNLPAILEALGVDHVQCVDAFNMKAVRAALKNATQNDDLDVIVFQGSCVLLDKSPKQSYVVTPDCTGCGICKTLGCPAIASDPETGISSIDPDLCIGCDQCRQYCNFGAIEPREGSR
ncbi:putative indolepyruvate ferredoxin oxidoreductase alpha subunit [Cryptobacterium sp. CAG:338]|nr:putative indolepyruvate ferredoxin oxidoreductase alpha subunit [Cryptobacterium sp. CAG:338]